MQIIVIIQDLRNKVKALMVIKTKQNGQNASNDSISNIGWMRHQEKFFGAQEHNVFSVVGLFTCILSCGVGDASDCRSHVFIHLPLKYEFISEPRKKVYISFGNINLLVFFNFIGQFSYRTAVSLIIQVHMIHQILFGFCKSS